MPRESVEVVSVQYRGDDWAVDRSPSAPPPRDSSTHLAELLAAVGASEHPVAEVAAAWRGFTGDDLPKAHWREALYDRLARNDLCYQIANELASPMATDLLAVRLSATAGRPVSEEEILCWLVLGAA